MDKKKQLPECPVVTVLELIGNKWKILIIRDLLDGKKRFGELRKTTGSSQKSLTSNLRELENDGLLIREVFAQVPPRVEYSLSDVGHSLAPILDTMADWGEDYKKYCKLKQNKN